jgi:hypothetical protein
MIGRMPLHLWLMQIIVAGLLMAAGMILIVAIHRRWRWFADPDADNWSFYVLRRLLGRRLFIVYLYVVGLGLIVFAAVVASGMFRP